MPGVGKTTLLEKIDLSKFNDIIGTSKFLQYYADGTVLEDNKEYDLLAKYSMDRINKSYYSNLDKIMLLSWSYYGIVADIKLRNNKKFVIISDEGLFKNLRPSLTDLYNNNIDLFKKLMRNRVIIYFYAPAQVIAERIKMREIELGVENVLPQYKKDTVEELVETIEESLEKYESFVEKISKETMVLLVDTTDDIKDNVARIETFISNIGIMT